jgi:hypothetical protein
MSAALPPDLAIAYVRELSADVRAVVVLDARGTALAGPAALAEPARAFLAAAGPAADAAERTEDGVVVAARTATHAVLAVAGPLALEGPTAVDARAAAEALGGKTVPDPGFSPAAAGSAEERQRAANAVISATHRLIRPSFATATARSLR